MATVKVKLRPSSIEGRSGIIFYQIVHDHTMRQISTRLRVRPSDWDAERGTLVVGAFNRTTLQERINGDLALLQRIICDLESRGRAFSVTDIIACFKSLQSRVSVSDYMRTQIVQLRANNRFGTAKNYEKTLVSFSTFLGGARLPITALTEQVIADYNTFLIRRGLVRNSVSFYMRVLRAVYNKAVRQKLVHQTDPFAEVYTGIDRTRKRAVAESVILAMNRLELPAGSQLALCRDLFMFSYCMRGMTFVDIAYLKKENLKNGAICYVRRKTGQQLSVRVEPAMLRIINRYADADSPYIFPILTAGNAEEQYEQYQVALSTQNRLLGTLSAMLGCEGKFTTYTARHSWATAARDHNIPIAVISQGMGHTSEQTTRIYLTMLENSVLDEANRGIIDLLS